MRLRRIPKAKEVLSNHPLVVHEPQQWKGQWHSYFPKAQPLHVELGTGKGQFLATASSQFPERNWIGVERIAEALYKAVRKGEKTENKNLRYLWMDVNQLEEVFAAGEVNRFYLHFSDPWPKKRHTKRRLTYHPFLQMYRRLLHPEGDLIFKTDNEDFYYFSLKEFTNENWLILEKTTDLHHSPWREQNITTEYEDKFVNQGLPIFYARVKPR